jgi:hypothetical protein
MNNMLANLNTLIQNYKYPRDRTVVAVETTAPIIASSLFIGHTLDTAYEHTKAPRVENYKLNEIHSPSARPIPLQARPLPVGISMAMIANAQFRHPKGEFNPRAAILYKEIHEGMKFRQDNLQSTLALLPSHVTPQTVDDSVVAPIAASVVEKHLAREEELFARIYNVCAAGVDGVCVGDLPQGIEYLLDAAWSALNRTNEIRFQRLAWLYNCPIAKSFRDTGEQFVPLAMLGPMKQAMKLQAATGLSSFLGGGGGAPSASPSPSSSLSPSVTSSLLPKFQPSPYPRPSPFLNLQAAPATDPTTISEKITELYELLGRNKPKGRRGQGGNQKKGDDANSTTASGGGKRQRKGRWRGGFNNQPNQAAQSDTKGQKNGATALLSSPLVGKS